MLLIDTLMLVRRCYAKMDFLKNSRGRSTGLEFGTLRTLESLQKKYPDQQVVLCLDSAKSFRREKCLTYKANRARVLDDSYYARLKVFMKFLRAIYCTSEKTGYEADDVMHTLSRIQEGFHYVYTNDHDLLQSVRENVHVIRSFKSQLFVWDEDKVSKEYGLSPELLPEYQAFVGDKTDNITGVPRIVKTFLVDLINWAHANGQSRQRMLTEVATAAWPPKLKRSVNDFLDEGTWELNYDLIKLRVLPDLEIVRPTNDDDYVLEKLKEWEIRSLELCKKYDLVDDDAEF